MCSRVDSAGISGKGSEFHIVAPRPHKFASGKEAEDANILIGIGVREVVCCLEMGIPNCYPKFVIYRETFELLSWLRVIYFRKPPWPYNFQVSKFDPYCIKHPQIVEVLSSKAHCIPLPLYNMVYPELSPYIPIKLSV
jgi:hypothetical protein